MTSHCDTIKCLSNSSQRLQILDVLDGTYADLRDLKTKLNSPRTTLQRNLSVLEKRGWVEKTRSGYTTTTAGCLIFEEFMTMSETAETIQHIAPFLEVMDAPAEIDIGRFDDPLVTVPERGRPDAPTKRLFDSYNGADYIKGLLPAVSFLLVELSRYADEDTTTEHEYIISQETFNVLQEQYDGERTEVSEMTRSVRTTIRIYEDDLPYGLFISGNRLALAAYDDVGRMQALVESTSEESIEWGEQVYENYRHQSKRPHAMDGPYLVRDSETAD